MTTSPVRSNRCVQLFFHSTKAMNVLCKAQESRHPKEMVDRDVVVAERKVWPSEVGFRELFHDVSSTSLFTAGQPRYSS